MMPFFKGDLMLKIIRMKGLFTIYQRSSGMKYSPEDSNAQIISSWMTLQIRHLAGDGILQLEAEIFDELDRLIFNDGIGKRNPIPTWACLWLLVLIYKEQMRFIHYHYLEEPTSRSVLLLFNPLLMLARNGSTAWPR